MRRVSVGQVLIGRFVAEKKKILHQIILIMISKCQICLSSSSTDCDSSSEESEPGPAPKKKRDKQQETSTLMATDEEEQTEGSILEINVKNVQCWLF